LLKEPGRILLEVGPGQTLSTFVRQRAAEAEAPAAVIPSLRYTYDRKPDAQFLLEALGRLWAAGAAPDWKAFRGGERRLRVRLPTYPWERQRYWIEAPSAEAWAAAPRGRRTDPAEWTYVPAWKRTPAPPASGDAKRVLVLSAGGVGEALAEALGRNGHEVVHARAGDHFAGEGHLRTLRAGHRGDHRALMDSLDVDGFRPDVVVDARPTDSSGAEAFGALLLLADALGGAGAAKLVVVTFDAVEVESMEGINPHQAALLGACAVLPREYPSLACRAVDVVPAQAGTMRADELTLLLAKDVVGPWDEPVTAYRGRHRWVRTFEPFPAPSPAALREGGAYLLVGDAAGRNASFAAIAAATPGVRIALVVPATDAGLAARLEAGGAQVRTIQAELADRDALAAAVREAAAWAGPIHGVVCSPELGGAAGLALVSEAEPAEWAAQVAEVGEQLAALNDAIAAAATPEPDPAEPSSAVGAPPAWEPDFCLVESSLAGVLGVVGRVRHAAANAFTDAFCVRRRQGHGEIAERAWTSVAWDRWLADWETEAEDGLRESEVGAALERVLALAMAGEPVVLVSSSDLDARVHAAASPPAVDAAPADGGTRYASPLPERDYAPPASKVEEQLVEMWQALLGIERVGVHDDFFALGGHSLLATQIISRVRVLFRVDLRLAAIFEAPTVARLGELIEDAIIAELEALSDEEVAALVAG
ncbi:MAG TPA: phosphopantetheine-binding protein, partial [Longimicrobium sp.]|nr:phosphopantetheine-binding protein [Longimicrobium sp.]